MSLNFEPREYPFVIELGAGPFYSPMMGRKLSNGYASVEFYDGPIVVTNTGEVVANGANLITTPGSGELTFTATESSDSVNGSYGSVEDGVVVVSAAYDRPNWGGPAKFVKVEETVAVVGATHAVVRILRT